MRPDPIASVEVRGSPSKRNLPNSPLPVILAGTSVQPKPTPPIRGVGTARPPSGVATATLQQLLRLGLRRGSPNSGAFQALCEVDELRGDLGQQFSVGFLEHDADAVESGVGERGGVTEEERALAERAQRGR